MPSTLGEGDHTAKVSFHCEQVRFVKHCSHWAKLNAKATSLQNGYNWYWTFLDFWLVFFFHCVLRLWTFLVTSHYIISMLWLNMVLFSPVERNMLLLPNRETFSAIVYYRTIHIKWRQTQRESDIGIAFTVTQCEWPLGSAPFLWCFMSFNVNNYIEDNGAERFSIFYWFFSSHGHACERFLTLNGMTSLHNFNALARPHVSRHDFLGINQLKIEKHSASMIPILWRCRFRVQFHSMGRFRSVWTTFMYVF